MKLRKDTVMKFIRQIKIEIKNIFRSKFILIIAIIALVWSFGSPLLSLIAPQGIGGGMPIPLMQSSYAVRAERAYSKMVAYPGGGG